MEVEIVIEDEGIIPEIFFRESTWLDREEFREVIFRLVEDSYGSGVMVVAIGDSNGWECDGVFFAIGAEDGADLRSLVFDSEDIIHWRIQES